LKHSILQPVYVLNAFNVANKTKWMAMNVANKTKWMALNVANKTK